MRPVEELINTKEPGWNLVKAWIDSAKNTVEVLSRDSLKARNALFQLQVTTRSPMGAIVYMTGGLLIDNGWIRILGSGSSRFSRSLPAWNKGKAMKEFGDPMPFLLIADDVIGGFFAINNGAFGNDIGKVYYLAPDTLEWEPLDQTYSEFLLFCFNGDLHTFYENNRWPGWKEDVVKLDGNEVFNFFPPMWSKEGKEIAKSSKKLIPVEEQYNFNLEMRKQLGIK
jgi:hypothetical protein